MSTQREAFETWAKKFGMSTSTDADDDYRSSEVFEAWESWQAAQAAMQIDPDAARYRWLRQNIGGAWALPVGASGNLDKLIDAQIARQEQNPCSAG